MRRTSPGERRASGPYVLLVGGPGLDVVGTDVRTRNRRVLEREGLYPVEETDLDALPAGSPLLVLPSATLVQPGLRSQLPAPTVPFRVTAPGLRRAILWGPVGDLRPLLTGDGPQPRPLRKATVPEAVALDAGSPGTARAAGQTVMKWAAGPNSSVMGQGLFAPANRRLGGALLRLGLAPEHATLLSLLLGLGGAALLALEGPLTLALGGVLLFLAWAGSSVDGHMARAAVLDCSRGALWNTAANNLVNLACLGGIVAGWARGGANGAGLALAGTLLVAMPALMALLWRFARAYEVNDSNTFLTRCLERAMQSDPGLGTWLVHGVFRVLRRDVFSVVFLVICLAGSRSVALSVIATVLIGVVACLAWQWPRVTAAADALRVEQLDATAQERLG